MQIAEGLKSIYAILVKVAASQRDAKYSNSQLAVKLFANHLIAAVNVKLNVNFSPLVIYFEI